ncbi:hypothetical protein EX895_001183 [Sporisorium graminicola]|uniref:Uncharacterized protein n=1 Tax=Sporisorium graminicola TaxID=280036 RepID=A0A4U7KZP4_9BASI|nr:hypothetical protein EX895_001183 [Sporisorium graminicola]TKY89886.1 hypothetical protein EX895_001183 [Sporisorium graminicola]
MIRSLRHKASFLAVLFVAACSVSDALALSAASILDKRGLEFQLLGTSSPTSTRILTATAPRRSPYDDSPISFDDIIQGHFLPVPISQTRIAHIIEGNQYPETLLFADVPQPNWAPIVDLTQPQSFRSLNALLQRYRHLHIYRNRFGANSGEFDSIVLLTGRSPKVPAINIAAGARVFGLNERIREMESIRRRYGMNVAWARFHSLFRPIEGEQANARAASKTWADIVASPFVHSVGMLGIELRQHLDHFRMGKFLSIDGSHVLGIRISPEGVAEHYEQALHQFLVPLRREP